MFALDAHQAPRSAAQVGESGIRSRDSRYGRGRVVASHGDYGYLSQSRFFGQVVGQGPYHRARHDDRLGQDRRRNAGCAEQFLFETLGGRVEQLRSRSIGVFAYRISGEHVGQQIRHEEDPVGVFERSEILLFLAVELVEAVEVHDLDAGQGIDFLAGDLPKKGFGSPLCIGIAVGPGQSEDCSVRSDMAEVHPPGVDTDRIDLHPFAGAKEQGLFQGFEQGENIPVVFSVQGQQRSGKAVDLFHFKSDTVGGPEDGPSAGGPQVEGQKIAFVHSIGKLFVSYGDKYMGGIAYFCFSK